MKITLETLNQFNILTLAQDLTENLNKRRKATLARARREYKFDRSFVINRRMIANG